MLHVIQSAVWTALAVLALTGALHALPWLGPPGRAGAKWAVRAPGLDVVVALLTWAPWLVGAIVFGWVGFVGAVAGELLALGAWITLHELAHREAARGPRIVKVINRAVGRWQNHVALWVTAVTYPLFWGIRFAQIAIYPLLTWLIGLPRYRQGEWVNVSRQKFDGLIGHDLIWCLYCDWMTGVYSLGAEMLRNVESFWCPIRFYDGKKCENCRVDFPDIDGGWVPADGTMAEVTRTLEEKYGSGRREWFGHPARKVEITVSATPAATSARSSSPPQR
jgi:hypothetical protein